MKTIVLSSEDILSAYDCVNQLYPYMPSLSHWRSWEYASYTKFFMSGKVLDLGCGDGNYFKLLWPQVPDTTGVDLDPNVAQRAKQSGVYRNVHVAPAHNLPEAANQFDYVFANCSLEHMDHLDDVLSEIYRCLKPGGRLLCSVVTDRFITWSLLPKFVHLAGFDEASGTLEDDFLEYHHLANPLTPESWQARFSQAGLIPQVHIPILPKYNTGFFLLMDSLWHIQKKQGGEFGDIIFPFLSANPSFPHGFRKVLEGLLHMETDWQDCSGAVFLAEKLDRKSVV